jgi:hypothetical protein
MADVRRCDFCGHRFELDEAESACTSCPLSGGCHLIRCPRCGYEMPPESKLVGWARRLSAKWRRAAPEAVDEVD